MTNSTTARNPNFDLLRLYLAISVLITHAELFTGHFYRALAPFVLLPPVPTFIALSGFLIPSSFDASRNAGHFAWKRFLRIAPALAMSFLIVAVLFGTRALWPTFLFYLHAGVNSHGSKNVPLWSLLVEEALYAVFVIMRLADRRWSVRSAWLTLLLAAGIWAVSAPTNDHVWMIFACPCSFFAGNILWFYRERPIDLRLAILAGGLAAIGTLFLPAAFYQVVTPVVAVFLVDRLPRIKFWRSDLSYGCYIYHAPVILYLGRALFGHVHAWPLAVLLGSLSITLTLSYLSWRFVEAPALRLKSFTRSSMTRPGSKVPAVPDLAAIPAHRSAPRCSTAVVPAPRPGRSDC